MKRFALRARIVPALLSLLLLAASPMIVRADELDPAGTETTSYQRVFRYVSCAVGVATAASGLGLVMAIGACLLLIETP